MGMTIHICEGRPPKDPVEPREPREPRGPCMGLIQNIDDNTRIKLALYEYLFDSRCEAARYADKLESDPHAELLSSAFFAALFNVATRYDDEKYTEIPIHDEFGMGVIAEMLRYAVGLSSFSEPTNLGSPNTAAPAHIKSRIEAYMQAYPLPDAGDLSDLAVLIGRCYVKAIKEFRSIPHEEKPFLAHHHLAMAYDVTLTAMRVFGNRHFKDTLTADMFEQKLGGQ